MAAAIVIGGYLRFEHLAALELSADEGASWAAAAAPSITEVLRLQARLNRGKLGLHDVALHLWMGAFGDSLVTMRALSAAAGTIAIVLVFLVALQILGLPPFDDRQRVEASAPDAADNTLLAAIAALLFAVNLVTIKYSREARMYPLALAFTLGQACVFLRSLRRGGIANYAATAGLTALAISATFSTALALIPEGLYLALMLMRSPARNAARVVGCAASIIGGILLLAPFLIIYYLRTQSGPADAALLTWIARPSIGAPIALFNKATGTYGFPLLAILVVTGVARGWSQRCESICYLLLWSFAPPIVLMIVSFAIHPAFVERYLLSCFVPFFALAAIGVLELRPAALRPGAVALLVAVALAHDATWSSRTHGDEWAEATA
ncbi:MAG: hypothetical protein ACREQD_10840, partial [Candidatus Binataceae bacterium]